MNCEQCGNDCWDNRNKNAQRAANGEKPMPDFKCKDASCGWKKWPPKGQRSNGGGAPLRNPPPRNNRPLGPLYNECMAFAQKACAHYFKGKETPADIIAATATLFIQAVRDGVSIAQAKPKPAPPPPVEEFEEFPAEDDDASSLPF